MKLLTQKLDTSNITDYCGVIYQEEPSIFVKTKTAQYLLRVRNNTAIPIEDINPSKISEEVFFDNSIDLYEWAVNRLKAEGFMVNVSYKLQKGLDIIESNILLKVYSKKELHIKQILLDNLIGCELLEFKILD